MFLSIEEGAALSAGIEAAFDASGERGVLEVKMPNGKAFGECTADDIREIGKAYNGLAARSALTPGGIVAQKFLNGVYLEMARARLGDAALKQTGRDFERAKPILRRLMAADPVILTHLLECALDDEVCATISAFKAKASAQGHAASEPAAPHTLEDLLQDCLVSVHELEHGQQFGTPDTRGITNYELAARCALEQIQAASLPRDGATHGGSGATDTSRTIVAGLGPYAESRPAPQRPDRLLSDLDLPKADCELRRRGNDATRAEVGAVTLP